MFADVYDEDRTTRRRYEAPNWFSTTEGQHRIRILDNSAHSVWLHFVRTPAHERGLYLVCLDEECPICDQNRKIINENPDNFRDVKGYWGKSKRFYVNVLDRTEVKVCPQCQWENKKGPNMKFTEVCSKRDCDNIIIDVEPKESGKVKILAKGKRLFEPLEKNVYKANLDADGEPIPITEYDVFLNVAGTGRDTLVVPAISDVDDEVNVPEEALYDLPTIPLKLEPDEIPEVLNGVRLKDIFAKRRGEEVEELAEEIREEVASRVGKIFETRA